MAPMRHFFLASLVAFVAFFPLQAAGAKTLRMAYDSDPTSLDPHEQLSGATLQLSHLLFDPLIRFKQDLNVAASPRAGRRSTSGPRAFICARA